MKTNVHKTIGQITFVCFGLLTFPLPSLAQPHAGDVDSTFDPGAGPNDSVAAIALQSDGKVLLGGNFTSFNDLPRARVVRLYGAAPVVLSSAGVFLNQFGFDITGESSLTVLIEASTNLANWTPLATNRLAGSPLRFNDPASANLPHRSYRARVQ